MISANSQVGCPANCPKDYLAGNYVLFVDRWFCDRSNSYERGINIACSNNRQSPDTKVPIHKMFYCINVEKIMDDPPYLFEYNYVADVKILSDAYIIEVSGHDPVVKLYADRIFITEFTHLTKHPLWSKPGFAAHALAKCQDPYGILYPIPLELITKDFVRVHGESWIEKENKRGVVLPKKYYKWLLDSKPCNILMFPAAILTEQYWKNAAQKYPQIKEHCPYLTERESREIFFSPERATEVILKLPKKSPAMKFMAASQTAITDKYLNSLPVWSEPFEDFYRWNPAIAQLNTSSTVNIPSLYAKEEKETDPAVTEICNVFNRLVDLDPFLKALATAKILREIRGDIVRDVVAGVLEGNITDKNVDWSTFRRKKYPFVNVVLCANQQDINENSALKKILNRLEIKIHHLNYRRLAKILAEKEIDRKVVYSDTGEELVLPTEDEIPVLSYDQAGPCRIVIRYQQYGVMFMSEKYTEKAGDLMNAVYITVGVSNGDDAATAITDDSQVKILCDCPLLRSKEIMMLFRTKTMMPFNSEGNFTHVRPRFAKMLYEASELCKRGYTVNMYSGLAYHIYIQIYRALADWCIGRKKIDWCHSILNYASALLSGDVEIGPDVVRMLDSDFIQLCETKSKEWNEDFSCIYTNVREWLDKAPTIKSTI